MKIHLKKIQVNGFVFTNQEIDFYCIASNYHVVLTIF